MGLRTLATLEVLHAAPSYDGRIKSGLPDRRQRRNGASQLGQLGVRPPDLYVSRTEGDHHGVVILDRHDPAKAERSCVT